MENKNPVWDENSENTTDNNAGQQNIYTNQNLSLVFNSNQELILSFENNEEDNKVNEAMDTKLEEINQEFPLVEKDTYMPLLNEDEMNDRQPSDEFGFFDPELDQIMDLQLAIIDENTEYDQPDHEPLRLDEDQMEQIATKQVFRFL